MKNKIVNLGKANWWIILILLLMWGTIIGFFYLKADEVTKDPCSICAERMGEKVVCTIGGIIPISKLYYPNGTIIKTEDGIKIQMG